MYCRFFSDVCWHDRTCDAGHQLVGGYGDSECHPFGCGELDLGLEQSSSDVQIPKSSVDKDGAHGTRGGGLHPAESPSHLPCADSFSGAEGTKTASHGAELFPSPRTPSSARQLVFSSCERKFSLVYSSQCQDATLPVHDFVQVMKAAPDRKRSSSLEAMHHTLFRPLAPSPPAQHSRVMCTPSSSR